MRTRPDAARALLVAYRDVANHLICCINSGEAGPVNVPSDIAHTVGERAVRFGATVHTSPNHMDHSVTTLRFKLERDAT